MHDLLDKTARCILVGTNGFLLVQHSNCSPGNRGKWGLPGGHLQADESARCTLHRELKEELFIDVAEFEPVGRYRYKDRWHRVFSASFEGTVERWDVSEIAVVGWYSGQQVEAFERAGQLHAGFEAEAIRSYTLQRTAECQGSVGVQSSEDDDRSLSTGDGPDAYSSQDLNAG